MPGLGPRPLLLHGTCPMARIGDHSRGCRCGTNTFPPSQSNSVLLLNHLAARPLGSLAPSSLPWLSTTRTAPDDTDKKTPPQPKREDEQPKTNVRLAHPPSRVRQPTPASRYGFTSARSPFKPKQHVAVGDMDQDGLGWDVRPAFQRQRTTQPGPLNMGGEDLLKNAALQVSSSSRSISPQD